MKKIIKDLVEFKPFNEQEKNDKIAFLKFIESFDDVLTRENVFGHFSSSAFVLNKEKTKVLLVYHNIFDGYIFPGGHVDGEKDFISVAKREIEEETGVKARLLNDKIFSILACPVSGHIKRGKYISSHTHFDVEYLFEADDTAETRIKADENKSVVWVPINELKNIKLVDFCAPAFNKFVAKLESANNKDNQMEL